MSKIIVKTPDGTMGFVELADDVELVTPLTLVDKDGVEHEFEHRDWCGQFNGPSIPVYEEVTP